MDAAYDEQIYAGLAMMVMSLVLDKEQGHVEREI